MTIEEFYHCQQEYTYVTTAKHLGFYEIGTMNAGRSGNLKGMENCEVTKTERDGYQYVNSCYIRFKTLYTYNHCHVEKACKNNSKTYTCLL